MIPVVGDVVLIHSEPHRWRVVSKQARLLHLERTLTDGERAPWPINVEVVDGKRVAKVSIFENSVSTIVEASDA